MKAVIPAAGLGTRLLPVTKVVPKELLPIEGKPAIQWALEEAAHAGLGEIVIVISPRKTILRDYLTPLEENHPLADYSGLDELERLLRSVNIVFIEQPEPLGLGDAVLRCRDLIGDEPFALMLPDNVFNAQSRLLEGLIEAHRACEKSCVGLWHADAEHLGDGAIAAEALSETVYSIRRVFPKGALNSEATDMRPVGRGVFEPAAFDYLKRAQMTSGEFDDVPMLDGLARDGALMGLLTTEIFYDLGDGANQKKSLSAP